MAIQINGNGTITGISVGGLPDGIVDTDMLAAGAATQAKRTYATGEIIQVVTKNIANELELTSALTSYADMTDFNLAITPTSATSLLYFNLTIAGCKLYDTSGADHRAYFGLTDDGASSYLQQTEFRMYEYGGGYHLGLYHKAPLIVSHIKTAGSTSARTYQLRWKFLQGEGLVVNETSSPEVSTMTITEIKA